MATIFYSGVDRPDLLSLLVAENAAGMINANYATQPRLQQAYSRSLPVPLVLDSYKFQNDISRYTEIILQVGMHFRWMSNLDVIGNQRVSDQHFEYLQAHLPAHLAQKILWVLQPGGSLELERMAQERRLIGIGGMVRLLKTQRQEAVLRYLFSVGERIQRVGAQAHVFGLASPSIIFRIRNEAWLASIDSSKWLVAYRARNILRMSGTGQCRSSELGLCLTPDEMAANNVRVMRFWLQPTQPGQLQLFEEMTTSQDEQEEEALFSQFIVILQGSLDDAFLERFAGQVVGLDAGDEEGDLFYSLFGDPALENDLVRWCQDAKCIGRLADYDVWCEEETIAA